MLVLPALMRREEDAEARHPHIMASGIEFPTARTAPHALEMDDTPVVATRKLHHHHLAEMSAVVAPRVVAVAAMRITAI
jgi:hypothetical protein